MYEPHVHPNSRVTVSEVYDAQTTSSALAVLVGWAQDQSILTLNRHIQYKTSYILSWVVGQETHRHLRNMALGGEASVSHSCGTRTPPGCSLRWRTQFLRIKKKKEHTLQKPKKPRFLSSKKQFLEGHGDQKPLIQFINS